MPPPSGTAAGAWGSRGLHAGHPVDARRHLCAGGLQLSSGTGRGALLLGFQKWLEVTMFLDLLICMLLHT